MSVNKTLFNILHTLGVGDKIVIMNKDRFGYFVNNVEYKQCPVSTRLQATGPPHLHCDGSVSPQIRTDVHSGPGMVLVLGSHKRTPQVHRAYVIVGSNHFTGQRQNTRKTAVSCENWWEGAMKRERGGGNPGSIWRKIGLPVDPALGLPGGE